MEIWTQATCVEGGDAHVKKENWIAKKGERIVTIMDDEGDATKGICIPRRCLKPCTKKVMFKTPPGFNGATFTQIRMGKATSS